MAATDLFHSSHHNMVMAQSPPAWSSPANGSWAQRLSQVSIRSLYPPQPWVTFHTAWCLDPGDNFNFTAFFSNALCDKCRGEVLAKQSAVPEQLVWAGSDLTNTTISSFLLLTTETLQNSSTITVHTKRSSCSYKSKLNIYFNIPYRKTCPVSYYQNLL